CQNGHSFPPTF
nr:immunoglobulin light chain junction region [Mus musculus]NSM00432.1 immunoglobulin light chain junction region [Mus musculus]NSM01360.1 immunoglobulin light chain junction region [Mus musculus]NSM02104.1 immunoglobulin light chain junction region [Mus musculus]NSM02352.1 immunoglobulin light chain junction region [Mus musculus]